MKEIKEPKWKTEPISCTCQVMKAHKPGESPAYCDKPTVAAYPAWGGGWMALCRLHARKHLGSPGTVLTDDLIVKGEKWA